MFEGTPQVNGSPRGNPDASRRAYIMRIIATRVAEVLQNASLVARLIAAAQRETSFRAVAQLELPDYCEHDENAATNIVAGVLQDQLKPEEYEAISQRNLEKGRERGVVAARKAAGIIEWPDAEYNALLEQASLHLHAAGRQKGKPDCTALAKLLNNTFHAGNDVRTPGAVRRMLGEAYKAGFTLPDNGETITTIEWSEEENMYFVELMQRVTHPVDHQHAGRPDFNTIATMLNDRFHSEQAEEGQYVRTGSTCNRHAGLIRKRAKRQEVEPADQLPTDTTEEAA